MTGENSSIFTPTLGSLGQSSRRGSGYFERSQKRSPYQSGLSVSNVSKRREGSIGFTILALFIVFLIYPVGLILLWNRRTRLKTGIKLLVTFLAALVFCFMLVEFANIETGNPQIKKIQTGLNTVLDGVYDFVSNLGDKSGLNGGAITSKLNYVWKGIEQDVALACINILGDKTDSAAYLKRDLPAALLEKYEALVDYRAEDAPDAPKPASVQSNLSAVVAKETPAPTPTPMPEYTPQPTPLVTQAPAKVSLPVIRSSSEAAVYYNPGGTYYHQKSTCIGMFASESHTLAEALRDGKAACPNCSVVSTDMLSASDYLWVDSKSVAHTSDLCSEFAGDYKLIPFSDVYEGHYTYCHKCKADDVYEYIRQNDKSYNVQYESLSQDEILLYEYEKTIEVYYGQNSRNYHSTPDCQQMYDETYVHTLFDALHKDGKKPCAVCNPYNEADASEYLEQLKQG